MAATTSALYFSHAPNKGQVSVPKGGWFPTTRCKFSLWGLQRFFKKSGVHENQDDTKTKEQGGPVKRALVRRHPVIISPRGNKKLNPGPLGRAEKPASGEPNLKRAQTNLKNTVDRLS
jgi:hypothetical protein